MGTGSSAMNGEGNSELSSSSDMDDLSGGEGNGTATAILGVVASRGRWGAWRAREGARASGFELNQGRDSGFGQGRDAWGSRWRCRRDDGGDGDERREQRKEMEVMA